MQTREPDAEGVAGPELACCDGHLPSLAATPEGVQAVQAVQARQIHAQGVYGPELARCGGAILGLATAPSRNHLQRIFYAKEAKAQGVPSPGLALSDGAFLGQAGISQIPSWVHIVQAGTAEPQGVPGPEVASTDSSCLGRLLQALLLCRRADFSLRGLATTVLCRLADVTLHMLANIMLCRLVNTVLRRLATFILCRLADVTLCRLADTILCRLAGIKLCRLADGGRQLGCAILTEPQIKDCAVEGIGNEGGSLHSRGYGNPSWLLGTAAGDPTTRIRPAAIAQWHPAPSTRRLLRTAGGGAPHIRAAAAAHIITCCRGLRWGAPGGIDGASAATIARCLIPACPTRLLWEAVAEMSQCHGPACPCQMWDRWLLCPPVFFLGAKLVQK